MVEVIYAHREFLNLSGHHSSAFVDAVMWEETYEDESSYTQARLAISDCDHKINLSIDLGRENIDNTLHKLDTLIEGARGLRKAVAAHKRKLPKGS